MSDGASYQSPVSPGRSWYEDTAGERPRYPRLDGSRQVDIVVVGGGYTGLSAAAHLARAGIRVAVLEAHRFGDGASGRNGGQMGTGQRMGPAELEADIGFERSKALFDLAESAKAHLLDFSAAHGIDIDYRPGQLSLAHKQRLVKGFEAEVDVLRQRYGYEHVSFMDRAETAERLGSPDYHAGMRDTGTGHIHPLKLLIGTARVATSAGAGLFENTPVLDIGRTARGIEARTPSGTVTAARALLAVNAYGGALNERAAAHVLPIRSYIAATEPLAEPHRVIPGGEAVDDSRFVVRYFRRTADDRLLFGGSEAYGSDPGEIAAPLKAQIESLWPHLRNVPITHAWGGSVAVTRTRMPYVAEVAPGITSLGGWSGHGVMLANYCGRLYAERVTGGGDSLRLLEELKVPAFPGGRRLRAPLLFLAMNWFALRDRI